MLLIGGGGIFFSYVKSLKSPNFDAANIEWFTVIEIHLAALLSVFANNKGADQPAQSDQRLCYSLIE